MSRVAKAPVNIPAGVEVKLDGQLLTVKGKMASYLAQFITQLKLNKIMVNLLSLHVKVLLERMLNRVQLVH